MMEAGVSSDYYDSCTTPVIRNKVSEIKVIIIGSKSERKCNAANIILDQNVFTVGKEIVQSEKRQRTVHNRPVTLVITPGWRKTHSLAQSSALTKMELVHSLELCPDPHAFLLVINLHDPFTNMHSKGVMEHMELFGEEIWKHTIVLLMYQCKTERDTDTTHLIKRAGRDLKMIISKCVNRAHVFNYTDSKGINVEKLFHEIESLIRVNSGHTFKNDSKLFEEMKNNRKIMKKRAEEQKMQVKKESLTGESCTFEELRIVLMGPSSVGKTSVANTILNTMKEKRRTKQCVMREEMVDKQRITIIDTPGWWSYSSLRETPKPVKQEIISSVSLCPPGLHAVLLVVQPGIAFTEAHKRSIKEHMELLGVNVWKYCIVVFSWGDWLGAPTVEEHIESEGENLQWLINKCGNRYHVLNNKQQDDRKQVRELMEKVELMARVNTDLLTAVSGAVEEMNDRDHEESCMWERGSACIDRPLLEETEDACYSVKEWLADTVSDYGTLPDPEMELIIKMID